MRRLFALALVLGLSVAFGLAQPAPCRARPIAGGTGNTCCCNTRNGLCCAEQPVCGSIIPGCFCQ